MKNKITITAVALLLSTFSDRISTAFAQGSLTPSGAPAATMKTLTQVEPRTPISSAPFNISQPGSYYLTTNLTVASGNAINISASGVTLDLSGFTISSTAPSATGYGIYVYQVLNVTILNGFIKGGVTNNGLDVYSGSGFSYGIYSSAGNTRVSGVSVSGCQFYGIYMGTGDSTVVEGCSAQTVGNAGITASTIRNCIAVDCGGTAILGDQVMDCRGDTSGYAGINASIVQNSYGHSSRTNGSAYGITAFTVQNSFGSCVYVGIAASACDNSYGYASTNGYGMSVTAANNCYGFCPGGTGISATIANNSYGYGLWGLSANVANGCMGIGTGSGFGLYANHLATACYGSSPSGTGLNAFIANVCRGVSAGGTPLTTSHNVNSF